MNIKIKTLKTFVFLLFCCYSFSISAQNRILFVKDVPIKLTSESSYSFFVGYEVEEDSDIAMDLSGGPDKFWTGKTVPVKKGKGVFQFKLTSNNKPRVGTGYRIVASVREKGGDWKTEKANSIIKNVEIVKSKTPIVDDASFSLLTPTSLASPDIIEFEINYKASKERLLQIALWNGGKWIAASKNITLQPGEGAVKATISAGRPAVGNTYRYVLYFGSGEGFPDKNIVSKEISGIQFTKAEKVLTLNDLKEKYVTIFPSSTSSKITLPGHLSFESIKIISLKGEIIKEAKNTNSIVIDDLPKGGYYAITNTDDYYKFVKF